MENDRKPSDDLREGLSLLLRAVTGAAKEVGKQVDVPKVARETGRVAEQAGKELLRIATLFGQTFEREIGVVSKSTPPPAGPADAPSAAADTKDAKPEPATSDPKPAADATAGAPAGTPTDAKR